MIYIFIQHLELIRICLPPKYQDLSASIFTSIHKGETDISADICLNVSQDKILNMFLTVSLSELNIMYYNILNVWQVSFLFETQTFSKWKYTNFEKSGKTLKRLRWVSQIYVIHIILLFIWIMCYKFVCDNKL